MVEGLVAIGMGLAIGLGAIGTGMAQGPIGAGVVGAVAEDRSFLGMGVFFIAIPETLVIFGLVIALLLMVL